LERQEYPITLDNTGNGSAFHYLLNQSKETIPAHQAKTITSSYPNLELSFDSGDGAKTVRVVLDPGTVWVGLDDQARFSLFRGPRLTATIAGTSPRDSATAPAPGAPRDAVFPVGDVR
jgi:hypothetical protein